MRSHNRLALLVSLTALLAAGTVTASAQGPSVRAYPARRMEADGDGVRMAKVSPLQILKGGWEVVVPDYPDAAPEKYKVPYFVNTGAPVFTEAHIASARSLAPVAADGASGGTPDPVVSVELNAAGAESLAEYSGANVGQSMAFRVNGRWLNFPTVRTRIRDGRAVLLDLTAEEIKAIVGAYGKE